MSAATRQPEFLLFDNSNTWTKYCFASRHQLFGIHRIPTPELNPQTLAAIRQLHPPPQTRVIVASVVPSKQKVFRQIWPGRHLAFVNHRLDLGITLKFSRPHRVGGDRIANTLGAAALYSLPAVVIDFGTAVTFDIISKKGEYLGGVIAPGLNAMTDYLHEKTALLPKLTLRKPKRAIAKSTMESMRVGAIVGYRGLIKEILCAIRNEIASEDLTVIATGGQGEFLARQVPEIQHVNPRLTLEGLRILAARHYPQNP